MKLIVCGGRDHLMGDAGRQRLDRLAFRLGVTEVVHGNHGKVDTQAGAWARRNGYLEMPFSPRWKDLGKAAGPIRNQQMADYCEPGVDACVAFPGGAGTADMVRRARKRGLRIFDWRNE